MKKDKTYSKDIIEIADFAYSNPELAKREHILAKFGKEWQKPIRTIDRLWKEAKEYNKNRLQRKEKIKEEVEDNETKESVKSSILSRNESLEILSSIAKGIAKKVGDEIIIPSDNERINAIKTMADFEGWKVPEKVETKQVKKFSIGFRSRESD